MTDRSDSGTGAVKPTEGIIVGTRIATGTGWRRVETVRPGDAVLTLDAGYQPVASLQSFRFPDLAGPPATWPLIVPRGALDCREPLLLPPDQRVLIVCNRDKGRTGAPVALVPALALEGWRGIRRIRPRARAEAVSLNFVVPQVIYASRRVLLACRAQPGTVGRRTALTQHPCIPTRAALSQDQARHLVACLMAEELGGALLTFCA